jgi:hypothetical protein
MIEPLLASRSGAGHAQFTLYVLSSTTGRAGLGGRAQGDIRVGCLVLEVVGSAWQWRVVFPVAGGQWWQYPFFALGILEVLYQIREGCLDLGLAKGLCSVG